jgi:hypothetical protein
MKLSFEAIRGSNGGLGPTQLPADNISIELDRFVDECNKIIKSQYDCMVADDLRIYKKRTTGAGTFSGEGIGST